MVGNCFRMRLGEKQAGNVVRMLRVDCGAKNLYLVRFSSHCTTLSRGQLGFLFNLFFSVALMPAWAESHLRERKELAVAQTIGALIAVKLSIHNPWRGRCIDKHKHGLLVPKMCIQETAPMVACLSKANSILAFRPNNRK